MTGTNNTIVANVAQSTETGLPVPLEACPGSVKGPQQQQVEPTSSALTPDRSTLPSKTGSVSKGWFYIIGGVVVFIICSIIQGMVDSSMFDNTYMSTSPLLDALSNITFYPGWLLTAGLIALGVMKLLSGKKHI